MVVVWICVAWFLLACVVALPLARLLRGLGERQDAEGGARPRPHGFPAGRRRPTTVGARRATRARRRVDAPPAPSTRPTLSSPSA